jgi:hypothetical protein
VVTTVIFCAAIAGIGLIAFMVADGRRTADPDRQRRLRIRARTTQLHAETLAQEAASDPTGAEERAAIEARLEAERRRSALVEENRLAE